MKKTYFTPNFNTFYLVKLLVRCYWKNGTVLFTDLILPIIIMSILFNVLPSKMLVQGLIPGIILSPIVSSSFISFTTFLVEWRNSVLMKKIKISQISTLQFFLAFLLVFGFIAQLLFWICFSYTLLLEQVGLKELEGTWDQLSNVDWGMAMLGLVQLILIANTMGFVVALFVNKTTAAVGICLTLFMVQAFLVGHYLPVNMVMAKEPMQIASYTMPFYAPTRIFQVAWLQDLKVDNHEGVEIMYIKDWTTYSTSGKEIKINFDKSYWSLILLSSGWIAVGIVVALGLNSRIKTN